MESKCYTGELCLWTHKDEFGIKGIISILSQASANGQISQRIPLTVDTEPFLEPLAFHAILSPQLSLH